MPAIVQPRVGDAALRTLRDRGGRLTLALGRTPPHSAAHTASDEDQGTRATRAADRATPGDIALPERHTR